MLCYDELEELFEGKVAKGKYALSSVVGSNESAVFANDESDSSIELAHECIVDPTQVDSMYASAAEKCTQPIAMKSTVGATQPRKRKHPYDEVVSILKDLGNK